MKYETPELTLLTPASDAIRGGTRKLRGHVLESFSANEIAPAYQDWE
jgi:hypothetical protein